MHISLVWTTASQFEFYMYTYMYICSIILGENAIIIGVYYPLQAKLVHAFENSC